MDTSLGCKLLCLTRIGHGYLHDTCMTQRIWLVGYSQHVIRHVALVTDTVLQEDGIMGSRLDPISLYDPKSLIWSQTLKFLSRRTRPSQSLFGEVATVSVSLVPLKSLSGEAATLSISLLTNLWVPLNLSGEVAIQFSPTRSSLNALNSVLSGDSPWALVPSLTSTSWSLIGNSV